MRFKSLLISLLIVSGVLTSCEFHCSVGSADKESEQARKNNSNTYNGGTTIYNNIDVHADQLHLKEAYLVNEKRG
jgi:hypothetical protein